MSYLHKRPRYRVIFYRRREIEIFCWSVQAALGLATAIADELSFTLGDEWTVEVLDAHNRVDHFFAVAYETQGRK